MHDALGEITVFTGVNKKALHPKKDISNPWKPIRGKRNFQRRSFL